MVDQFSHPMLWLLSLSCAIVLPWSICNLAVWIIHRCGDERLQALPYSIWRPLYDTLISISADCLYNFSVQLPKTQLYYAMNPERCNQQTFKVLLPYTEALTDELVQPLSPVIWDNLPLVIRNPVYKRVASKFKPSIDNLIQSLHPIITDHFNHKGFITEQMSAKEGGYKFILLESLHGYWIRLYRSSRNLSFILCLCYLILGTLIPQISSIPVLILTPIIASALVIWKTKLFIPHMKETFSRSMGFWLGEKMYLLDEFVNKMRQGGCTPTVLRGIIHRAFLPLLEDLPLKTAIQFGLGRQAPLDLRAHLIDYIILNASTPFEHSAFRQERALEISEAFEDQFLQMESTETLELLKPIQKALMRIFWPIILSIGILTSLIVWFI